VDGVKKYCERRMRRNRNCLTGWIQMARCAGCC
jgi:hypothetical protein